MSEWLPYPPPASLAKPSEATSPSRGEVKKRRAPLITSPLEGEVAGTAIRSGGWGVSDTQQRAAAPRNGAVTPARVISLPLVGDSAAHDDAVAVEAPLEVRLGGKPLTVLMRTGFDRAAHELRTVAARHRPQLPGWF